ncbi:MAG: carboxypeptidase regulatory-like domain-containing protein [Proteobacteria bacterium]|nr:carboxypeptidase regulatory-like domain-containing protein [Pseudomonadota bacterium]
MRAGPGPGLKGLAPVLGPVLGPAAISATVLLNGDALPGLAGPAHDPGPQGSHDGLPDLTMPKPQLGTMALHLLPEAALAAAEPAVREHAVPADPVPGPPPAEAAPPEPVAAPPPAVATAPVVPPPTPPPAPLPAPAAAVAVAGAPVAGDAAPPPSPPAPVVTPPAPRLAVAEMPPAAVPPATPLPTPPPEAAVPLEAATPPPPAPQPVVAPPAPDPPAPPPAPAPATLSSPASPAPAPPALVLPEPAFGKAVPAPALAMAATTALPPRVVAGDAPTATREPDRPPPAFVAPAPRPASGLGSAAAPIRAGAEPAQLAGKGPGGALAAPSLSYDDELILQLQTVHGEQADTISGFAVRGGGVYLPLGAIARFLDLAIAISDEGHYASGWFLDPRNALVLNLRQGTLSLRGIERALGGADALAFDGELYLRAERFAEIFPLTLTTDLRLQTVTVKTLTAFPFEQRQAREEARDRLNLTRGKGNQRRWPREPTPWLALDVPAADVETRAVSDSSLGTRVENDLHLAGDLAFLTARLFLASSSRDGLTGARLQLGRRDPDSALLGPLKASEFQIGDVATTALPLGLRGVSGRGGFLTNAPLERASVFEAIDFKGDLPDGWEVELYRNEALIGSTRIAVNGQYQFLRVPVDFGLNQFRLVFFGPQGQRREEVRRISVGDGRLAAGEFSYTLGAAQKDVSLFGVRPPNFIPSGGYGDWRAMAQLQYGLSAGLTAQLSGGMVADGGNGPRWLASTGLRTGLAGLAVKLDLGLESGGGAAPGRAVELGVGGRLAGLSYVLSHAEYGGTFTDEVNDASGLPLRRATVANLNGALRLPRAGGTLSIPLAARFQRLEFASGQRETDATLTGSVALGRALVTNALEYSNSVTPGLPGRTTVIGSFDLATLAGRRDQYRATVGYRLAPHPALANVALEWDHAWDERTMLKAALGRAIDTGQTSFGLSAARRFERFTLAFDGTMGVPKHDFAVALRLGFSFGRNPLSHRLFAAPPGLAAGGAAVVRAYRDDNGNGRFDAGEAVLPKVEFNSGSQTAITDEHGLALLTGLGDGTRASFQVANESLPDIALAPVRGGVEVVARAGRIHASDFPVIALSDIEGTALFGGGRGVSGLALLLLDARGQRVARARSEADGFFLFEQVRPGDYTIALDPGQARALKIRLERVPTLTIGPKSQVLRERLSVVPAADPDGGGQP